MLKHRGLLVFSDFETAELSTRSTKSASEKRKSLIVRIEN
ncbi:hypothetical protein VMA_000733 [Vibrio mimicus VM223]|nr:hypothetical protein VMA_000733 [Vibrio mimicus VM223]